MNITDVNTFLEEYKIILDDYSQEDFFIQLRISSDKRRAWFVIYERQGHNDIDEFFAEMEERGFYIIPSVKIEIDSFPMISLYSKDLLKTL